MLRPMEISSMTLARLSPRKMSTADMPVSLKIGRFRPKCSVYIALSNLRFDRRYVI